MDNSFIPLAGPPLLAAGSSNCSVSVPIGGSRPKQADKCKLQVICCPSRAR